MKQLNIESVRGDGAVWLPPDPYSKELLRSKEMYNLMGQAARSKPKARRYSGVILRYAHKEVIRKEYWGYVRKSYYYIPVTPKIEKGLLIVLSSDGIGRVFENLNSYPPGFGLFDCVYRTLWHTGSSACVKENLTHRLTIHLRVADCSIGGFGNGCVMSVGWHCVRGDLV